jgi:hypothetical protein
MSVIEIFRAGTHIAASGDKVTITETDLDRTAAVYSTKKWSAPLVLGHPANDWPGFGLVSRLIRKGTSLFAECANVSDSLKSAVRRRLYTNVSASFFTPGHPQNPVPGTLYLKHVGLLGAFPPAVKGMEPPCFSEPAGYIEFSTGELNAEFYEAEEPHGQSWPAGFICDRAQLPLYRTALAYQKAIPGISFSEAVKLAGS